MSFQTPSKAYLQMSPTFGYGRPYENKYHNMGQLTPNYQGRYFGVGGGYGPIQESAERYTLQNPTSIYPPNKQLNARVYLPSRIRDGYPCKPGIFYVKPQQPYSYYPQGQNPFFGNNVN